MTDIEKLAEHIISAQYSYDTPTQKAELIRAFVDGATGNKGECTCRICRSAYLRAYIESNRFGWHCAIDGLLRWMKDTEFYKDCPDEPYQRILKEIETMIKNPMYESLIGHTPNVSDNSTDNK